MFVAQVALIKEMNILDFGHQNLESDVLGALVFSSLLSAPDTGQNWHRPAYTFSRFVADCATHAGFDAIKYPSSVSPDGYNLVVFDLGAGWNNIYDINAIESSDDGRNWIIEVDQW